MRGPEVLAELHNLLELWDLELTNFLFRQKLLEHVRELLKVRLLWVDARIHKHDDVDDHVAYSVLASKIVLLSRDLFERICEKCLIKLVELLLVYHRNDSEIESDIFGKVALTRAVSHRVYEFTEHIENLDNVGVHV